MNKTTNLNFWWRWLVAADIIVIVFGAAQRPLTRSDPPRLQSAGLRLGILYRHLPTRCD